MSYNVDINQSVDSMVISSEKMLCNLSRDGFHSIFHYRNGKARGSCDVDIDQSGGSMVM